MHTFACSETQKFGHVTFFWNGNRSGFFDEDLETFVEVCSPKTVLQNEMNLNASSPALPAASGSSHDLVALDTSARLLVRRPSSFFLCPLRVISAHKKSPRSGCRAFQHA